MTLRNTTMPERPVGCVPGFESTIPLSVSLLFPPSFLKTLHSKHEVSKTAQTVYMCLLSKQDASYLGHLCSFSSLPPALPAERRMTNLSPSYVLLCRHNTDTSIETSWTKHICPAVASFRHIKKLMTLYLAIPSSLLCSPYLSGHQKTLHCQFMSACSSSA